jgi:hypothetical protein
MMSLRLSRRALGLLAVAGVLFNTGRCLAVYVPLGASADDWGLKFDVKVTAAEGDKMTVHFRLTDQGRLKPIYTTTLVAFSDPGYDGSRTFLAQTPIEMKPTKDGHLVGQTQITKDLLERAQIRILTLTVDGKRQTGGAASYYIPLKRFLTKAPVAAPSTSPESSRSASAKKGPIER